MSKAKHTSTPAECVPATEKKPLGECIGKRCKCPSCGKPADVRKARGGTLSNVPVTSSFWVMLACTGCGSRLERINQAVEVDVLPPPPPQKKPIGHVVGKFIKCPTEDCDQTARAGWTLDDGHIIDCPRCQQRVVPPETPVELVA